MTVWDMWMDISVPGMTRSDSLLYLTRSDSLDTDSFWMTRNDSYPFVVTHIRTIGVFWVALE